MSYALKTYRLLNSLSIDVAAGAVVCAIFLAEILRSQPGSPALIMLGLTVWIIYSADHLLDARRIETEAATHRHNFYQRHFGILVAVTGLAAVADIFLAMRIRPAVFQAGLILAAPVAIYLAAQRFFVSVKELLGAILYTAGVLLPAYVFMGERPVTTTQVTFVAAFFFIAWANLLLFSYFDCESDMKNAQTSFATRWGQQATRRVIFVLVTIGLGLSVYLSITTNPLHALVLLVMNLVLLMLMCYPAFFSRSDRFRMVGDSIFLIPLVAVLA
jgi:4-hydroxybenzoate polyprenyltransferase